MRKLLLSLTAVASAGLGLQPAAQAEPAKTGYADVNGLKMYYEIHGTGRPTLAIHGAYMSTESMKPFVEGLAKTRQVIVMDLQAHGRTADIDRPIAYEHLADDVATLMDKLGLEEADVFGYSLGATTAYQLAISHPGKVRRLAAASGGYRTDAMYPELVKMISQITPETFAGSPFEAEYKKLAPRPQDFPILVKKLVALDVRPQEWPAEAIKGIKAPTLVISSDADVIRPEHSVELYRLRGGGPSADFMLPANSELAILPGTSHIDIFTKRADWVVTFATAFFDKEIK